MKQRIFCYSKLRYLNNGFIYSLIWSFLSLKQLLTKQNKIPKVYTLSPHRVLRFFIQNLLGFTLSSDTILIKLWYEFSFSWFILTMNIRKKGEYCWRKIHQQQHEMTIDRWTDGDENITKKQTKKRRRYFKKHSTMGSFNTGPSKSQKVPRILPFYDIESQLIFIIWPWVITQRLL